MKIAAIDIGSNAARMQISSVLTDKKKISIKKVEYVRFALRLGMDVFNTGKISYESEARIKKLLMAYRLLMELHEVDAYMICATSAMREAENGVNIVERIKNELGMEIHLIDGEKEAELINNVIVVVLEDEKTYLHIDVGGGSTELSLFAAGELVASKSFNLGTIRILDNQDTEETWSEMHDFLREHTRHFKNISGIGTGGNINKLYKLAEEKDKAPISFTKLKSLYSYLNSFSLKDRINVLGLNQDRADVIIPACEIYMSVMKWGGIKNMYVPSVGMVDGIIQTLIEKNFNK